MRLPKVVAPWRRLLVLVVLLVAGATRRSPRRSCSVRRPPDRAYQAFAVVTDLLQQAGPETYTGADVPVATGEDRYAGWSLVVVYRSPSLPLRNLTVFDGLADVGQTKLPGDSRVASRVPSWSSRALGSGHRGVSLLILAPEVGLASGGAWLWGTPPDVVPGRRVADSPPAQRLVFRRDRVSNMCSSRVYDGVVDRHEPGPPREQHVWVRNHGDYGDPVPGVVVCWQHSPVHNVSTSEWVALVIGAPFDTALTISWVGAERLIPIRDDAPVDG